MTAEKPPPSKKLPLSHIKVLDLTTIIAGPFCTLYLAHMGAEVIKIEPVGRGDSGRLLGSDVGLNHMGMGALFLGMNAGKKSMTLNLKTDSGKDIFKQLVAMSDVVVENFRAGVMDKLGLGYDTLKNINPALVYCAISGYGQHGDMSERAAYDQIIQGVSGLMATTGESGTPYRVGVPISDTVAGLHGAFAIVSALNNPDRKKGDTAGHTGEYTGAYIDISMLESLVLSMGWVLSDYTVSGKIPTQNGNHSAISSPSGTFRTEDGMINIATNTQAQWADLATLLGHPEWIDTPVFADQKSRREHRDKLIACMESVLMGKPTAYWVEAIAPLKIPVGEIYRLDETLTLPPIKQRNLLQTLQSDGVDTPFDIAKPAIHIDGENPDFTTAPPALSEHTDRILKQHMGMDADAIQALRDKDII